MGELSLDSNLRRTRKDAAAAAGLNLRSVQTVFNRRTTERASLLLIPLSAPDIFGTAPSIAKSATGCRSSLELCWVCCGGSVVCCSGTVSPELTSWWARDCSTGSVVSSSCASSFRPSCCFSFLTLLRPSSSADIVIRACSAAASRSDGVGCSSKGRLRLNRPARAGGLGATGTAATRDLVPVSPMRGVGTEPGRALCCSKDARGCSLGCGAAGNPDPASELGPEPRRREMDRAKRILRRWRRCCVDCAEAGESLSLLREYCSETGRCSLGGCSQSVITAATAEACRRL